MWRRATPYWWRPAAAWSDGTTRRVAYGTPDLRHSGVLRLGRSGRQPKARSRPDTECALWTERAAAPPAISALPHWSNALGSAMKVSSRRLSWNRKSRLSLISQTSGLPATATPRATPPGRSRQIAAYRHPAARRRPRDCRNCRSARPRRHIAIRNPDAGHRLAVGMEGDRIVAANGKPGVPVDHDPSR